MATIEDLLRVAELEFSDLIESFIFIDYKVRIFIIRNNGFIDINLSKKLLGRFGFHWETMNSKNEIYRYDNFPDKNWIHLPTYPFHFHHGSQTQTENSPFPTDIIQGFKAFMHFVKDKMRA